VGLFVVMFISFVVGFVVWFILILFEWYIEYGWFVWWLFAVGVLFVSLSGLVAVVLFLVGLVLFMLYFVVGLGLLIVLFICCLC